MHVQLVHITKSHNPLKKFDAVLTTDHRHKTIPFGQAGALDFLQTKDLERRERYLRRHQKRENWNDPLTPGFWSRWYLWEKTTRGEAEKNIRAKFGL
jgi:hypothetical protein